MARGTIYLGIGAQKAGTSWLYHQIERATGFRQGLGKEYHVLDSLYVPGLDNFEKVFSQQIQDLRERIGLPPKRGSGLRSFLLGILTRPSPRGREQPLRDIQKRIARKERLIGMIRGKESYFDYIASRLSSPERFTLDFTPSYSALSENDLRDIRQRFAQRDVRVRMIYLLREPVCRLESAVRMDMRNEGILAADRRELAIQRMTAYGRSAHERSRSDYPRVISNLDAVFPSEDVFIGFYEELFTPRTVEAIASFCSIDPSVFDPSRQYNRSPSVFRYPRELIDELCVRYQDVYEFVRQRFPFDLGLWRESRAQIVES